MGNEGEGGGVEGKGGEVAGYGGGRMKGMVIVEKQ